MVWNDTMGSVGRTQGPAARESERKEKDQQRRAMERSNAKDLNELDSYIRHITGLHHETIKVIDWQALAAKPAPLAPEMDLTNSENVRRQLAQHEAGFVEWLMGRGKQTRAALERALDLARSRQHREILAKLAPYHSLVQAWETEQAVCHGVMTGDDGAMLSVIKSQQTLTKIHKLGRGLGFSVQGGIVHAVLSLHKTNIVPDFQFKYMPSGKLTEVKMPREKTMKLYRAYASSAVLKVASDLFRVIPRESVIVSCVAPCHVADSDYDEEWPVLSVRFNRRDVMALPMDRTDPVQAMRLFNVAEAFHPIHGFGRIAPILDIPVRMAI
ncbi:MAG: hypothetical protein ACRBBO_00220 [Cognatishimia sp.]